MSRVINRTPAVEKVGGPVEGKKQLGLAVAGVKILGLFWRIKEKEQYKYGFNKCKRVSAYNKKRSALVCSILQKTTTTKTKSHLKHSFSKLHQILSQSLHQQHQKILQAKSTLKTKTSSFMFNTLKKIYQRKIRDALVQVVGQARWKGKIGSWRNRFLGAVVGGLVGGRLRKGFEAIGRRTVGVLEKRIVLGRIGRIVQLKKGNNLRSAFINIILTPSKSQQTPQKPQSLLQSRTKQSTPKQPQPQPQPQPQLPPIEPLLQKSKSLEQQLQKLTLKKQSQLQHYKTEIEKLEIQQESLKFNSQILDQAIRELQVDIAQRQKKGRKGMPIGELWEKVYSNFLLLLVEHAGQTLSKEVVLQYLESPLTPLNKDITELQSQNEILTQLLTQYQKFFQDTPIPQAPQQPLLPYDILVSKNKFLYLTLQTLIKHGIGNETQIKQLEVELENVIKQA